MFFWIKKNFQAWFKKDVYLDYASTTPIDSEVLFVMNQVYKKTYGNPGAMYPLAMQTKNYISAARKKIATLIGATSDQVIFTRGGTESNNIAILGVLHHFKENYPNIVPHIITSNIEHDSVLELCRHLGNTQQAKITYIPCNKEGIIDVSLIKKELRPETILVTVMYANNEIGTIQPIREITKLIRWYKKQLKEKELAIISNQYPLVHTDAIQAVNYCDDNISRLGVDLMTVSGSKIYGPKSTGMLFVKHKQLLSPILFGGGQESGLRSGTEDVAAIAGFVKAYEIAQAKRETEVLRLLALRTFLMDYLLTNEDVVVNGSLTDRLPNNINVTVKNYSGEELVIQLATKGFAVSSKSACQSSSDEKSHVITALRTAQKRHTKSTEGSLRITLGRFTTRKDIQKFISAFQKIAK